MEKTKKTVREIFKGAPKGSSRIIKEEIDQPITRRSAKSVQEIAGGEVVASAVRTPTVKDVAKKSKIIKNLLIAAVAVTMVALGGSTYYFYHQYKKTTAVEAEDIAGKIGKFMELPSEPATLATVTDKDKVREQAFFAHSENGDKVLIYTQTKKAILYRPSTNKIIEVMYLSAGNQPPANTLGQNNSAQGTEQPAQTTPVNAPADQSALVSENVRVVVYNGTNTGGMAATVADKIAGMAGVSVTQKSNATGIFTTTIVVDLTGKGAAAQKIAEAVGGQVEEFPASEKKPENADILIIAGGE